MKQVFLLAGLHKTATTSIQLTCASHRDAMREHGFYYPVIGTKQGPEANHTRALNLMFREQVHKAGWSRQFTVVDKDTIQDREAFRERFASQLEPVERLVLVAEGASVLDVSELQAMKEWFAAHDCNMHVMCTVRHLGPWIQSMIAQRVTAGLRLSIPMAVEEFLRAGSIVQQRLENLRTVFPDVRFVSHEVAVHEPGGPVSSFLREIGYEGPPPARVVRANEGRSDCATRTMSILNEKFGPHRADGGTNENRYDDLAVIQAILTMPGRKFALRPRDVEPLLPLLHAENEWLGRELGTAFQDPKLVFPRQPRDWTPAATAQLRMALAGMPPPLKKWMLRNLPRLGLQPAKPPAVH